MKKLENNGKKHIYILSNSSNDGIECDLTQCEKMGKKWNPFNNTSDIVVSWTSISNWLTYTRWFIRPIWFWVKILYTCRSHHWRTSYIRIVLLGMFALSWQILRTAYFPSLPLHQLDQPQYFEIFWVKLAHSWWTEEKKSCDMDHLFNWSDNLSDIERKLLSPFTSCFTPKCWCIFLLNVRLSHPHDPIQPFKYHKNLIQWQLNHINPYQNPMSWLFSP